MQRDLATANHEVVTQIEIQGILLNGDDKTIIFPAKNCNADPDVGILACDEPYEYCKTIGDGMGECVSIKNVSVDSSDVSSLLKQFCFVGCC